MHPALGARPGDGTRRTPIQVRLHRRQFIAIGQRRLVIGSGIGESVAEHVRHMQHFMRLQRLGQLQQRRPPVGTPLRRH